MTNFTGWNFRRLPFKSTISCQLVFIGSKNRCLGITSWRYLIFLLIIHVYERPSWTLWQIYTTFIILKMKLLLFLFGRIQVDTLMIANYAQAFVFNCPKNLRLLVVILEIWLYCLCVGLGWLFSLRTFFLGKLELRIDSLFFLSLLS